ncbi:carbohydrate ABC transporter permease [Pelagovum pacificum]|uniref:sn-glycerol-3-phosphate transport system permease protein UgpE n=1 Tax=Pelagovum pacificum TaxID=2588711 RepID=A0A5C5GHF7_9RHOB|nr:carbohydrate ABC transporter permease [Pelagovum pacificum]QQA42647.1 carbohydrate ABC transporter permease [Pelagovum pacificum]TNY34202.1 carbohydrate ABC transporter permease [Pelagovum pacificum]
MSDATLGRAPAVRRRTSRFGPRLRRQITSVVLAAVCVVWVYPLVWMISASFKSNNEIFASTGLIPDNPTFENYTNAWVEANIGRYFFNTLFVTVGSVMVTTIAAALMGYVLGRRPIPGKAVLMGLMVFTLFIPQGYTIIPVFELLTSLGLGQSLWGLMLATCGHSIVIFTLLFAGYFTQLPNELEEASRMDGVGPVKTFWYVMLPLSKPIIVTVIVMQTLQAWNDFLLPLVVTLANPSMRTLSVGVYSFRGEHFIDWGGMTAASAITIVPVIILFLFLQRYFIDGLAGAVKG